MKGASSLLLELIEKLAIPVREDQAKENLDSKQCQ
jgi:hypothetical protein